MRWRDEEGGDGIFDLMGFLMIVVRWLANIDVMDKTEDKRVGSKI